MPAPAQGGYQVDTGINLVELDWARTRVMWVWLLIGTIGALSVGSYWVLTHHPEYVGQLLLSLLLQPSGSSAEDQKTAFDILQIVIGVVLSWLLFTALTLHGMTSLLRAPSPNSPTCRRSCGRGSSTWAWLR